MKTLTLLMVAMVIFASCRTNKTLTQKQLVSSIESTDKVGIILMTIGEDHADHGSSVIGRNSYYYTLPDTVRIDPSIKKPKKTKPQKVLVMDTLTRMVEAKYSAFIGTPLVPAKVGTKLPAAGLDAGIPCLPKQTLKQAINTTDLDKFVVVNVGWRIRGGIRILGINMGKKKPTAIIITKVFDRSGKKIWERTQNFDPGIQIKNRGVTLMGVSAGGKDGMSGNQLLDLMARGLDETFRENQMKKYDKSNHVTQRR